MDITPQMIKELKKQKRNFTQTVDLIVNLSNLDLKKPENRIRDKIKLPNKIKDVKVCLIVDSLLSKAKETGCKVLTKSDLEFTKREAKKLAKEYDFFVIEAPLMPIVAKILGKYISSRNKPMIPLPPNIKDLKSVIKDLEKTISINVVKNPVIQMAVGKEDAEEEKIIENCKYAIERIKELAEQKNAQIKSAYLKLTMSKPIRIL